MLRLIAISEEDGIRFRSIRRISEDAKMTPEQIEVSTTMPETNKDGERILIALNENEYAPCVFRGAMFICTTFDDNTRMILMNHCENDMYYSREVPEEISRDYHFLNTRRTSWKMTKEAFNRLEVFMIAGIDVKGKTVSE